MVRLACAGIGSAILLATSIAGHAADLSKAPIYKAPVYKAPYKDSSYAAPTWAGFYVGVSGGWATGTSRQDTALGPASSNFTLNGALIGATMGYNWQSGRLVYGIEADWSWSTKKGSAPEIAPFSPTVTAQTRENWLATVRGRLGWACTDHWLLYGTGGWAVAEAEASVTTAAGLPDKDTRVRSGWTLGAGTEYALVKNWSVKAEYLYVDFADQRYFDPPPPSGTLTRTNVTLNDHVFRLGLNHRF